MKPRGLYLQALVLLCSAAHLTMGAAQEGPTLGSSVFVEPEPHAAPALLSKATVSAHEMSEKITIHLETKHHAADSSPLNATVKDFFYLHRMSAMGPHTLHNLQGHNHPSHDYALREKMAVIVGDYMINRELLFYLRNMKFSRPYIFALEEWQDRARSGPGGASTSSLNGRAPLPSPWKTSIGSDLLSRSVFASATNDIWELSIHSALRPRPMVLGAIYAIAARRTQNALYALRYFDSTRTLSPKFRYHISNDFWINWDWDFPLGGKDRAQRIFQTLSVRILY